MKYSTRSLIRGVVISAIASLVSITASQAQNKLSFGQVMSSLVTSGETARKIGIDTEAIKRDVEARILEEGTENAQKPLPVLEVLKKLPQLVVQIQFDLDSDAIRPQSWVTVGRIADALHHPLVAGNRFLIVGHTDARGKRLYNFNLSERRAQSVVGMLTSTFKVNPSRLAAMGLGEEQLFDAADPNNGVNRRVEFFNMGPS
jgi:OOP family OmpA-OmpF porin